MKIGIITDIHSNINALNIVLKEFDKMQVDKIICCGDIIGIGANPEETVQALRKNEHKLIAVRGNHEQYLIEGLPKKIHDNKRKMSLEEIKNHMWNHRKLSEESKKFLSELPLSRNIEIENKRIYIVHYPINEEGKYKKHIKKPTIDENEKMFNEIDADIFLYGHTHTVNVNNKEHKWYINTGSLGCPTNTNIAKAGLLIIDNDKVSFQCLNIEYNVEKTIEEIKKIKFPFYKEILKIFYGQIIEDSLIDKEINE